MRKYELMMIVDPTISDDERATLLSEVKAELTTHGSSALTEDVMGAKKLAYKINASEIGFYVLFQFESDGRAFKTISSEFNLRKAIWRYMFVRLDD
ncbi:MAG: small subunit ribosomal protein [Patescibacteria group bacterium]|nr:small subunit ribosomal protein [Patescibacteria group bacterium]